MSKPGSHPADAAFPLGLAVCPSVTLLRPWVLGWPSSVTTLHPPREPTSSLRTREGVARAMASRGLDDEGVDEHAASTALALARRRERKRANADACRTRQKASGVPVSSAILSKTRERSPREAAAYRVRQCEKAATRGKPVGPDKDGGPLSRAPSSAAGPVGGAAVDLVLVSDGDGPTGHAGRFTLTAHIADAGTVVPAGGASDLPAPTAAITLGVAGPVNVDEAEDVDRAAVVPAAGASALPSSHCHFRPWLCPGCIPVFICRVRSTSR